MQVIETTKRVVKTSNGFVSAERTPDGLHVQLYPVPTDDSLPAVDPDLVSIYLDAQEEAALRAVLGVDKETITPAAEVGVDCLGSENWLTVKVDNSDDTIELDIEDGDQVWLYTDQVPALIKALQAVQAYAEGKR